MSSKVKIDKYIERYGKALYTYDFGDDWEHDITLEEIVDDYPYPYPQCLDWSRNVNLWSEVSHKGIPNILICRLYEWTLVLKRPKRRDAEETE